MNTAYPKGRIAREPAPARFDDADAVDLPALLRDAWRRKWTVIGAGVAAAVLVAIALSQVTPRYSAVAKIMLDPRERRVVSSEEVVSNLDLSDPVIASEVALIRSSVLLEDAIEAIGVESMAEFDSALNIAPAWRRAVGGVKAAVQETLGLSGSEPAAEANAADPPAMRPARRVVGGLRPHLDVYQEGNSYVIGIRATAEDPALAAEIVNAVAVQYIDSQLAQRVETTRRATAWLETRVADLESQVAAAEEEVEAHRASKLIADGGGSDTAAQQLAAMSGQLAVARADRAAAQARRDQIRALVEREGTAAAAEVLTSPLLMSLRESRSALLREDAELATRYAPTHPLRARLEAEIGRIETDLGEEIGKIIEVLANEVDVARIREDSIATDLLAVEERMTAISGSSIGLRQLEREAEALRGVYRSFLSRLKETRAQEALAQVEARVIESALPPGAPSYPRTKLLVAAGGVVGAAFGLGVVLASELGASGFRSVRQVEGETRLPVLASIPRERRHRSLPQALGALSTRPYGDYGESIRQLRTALTFGGETAPRSLVVASSLPGEGKTTTTLALAHMISLMGKRVIVVDCDFRRATLRAAFGWPAGPDLAAVLRGEAALEDAIVADPALDFDVLPTAHPVADLSDTLSPSRLRTIVDDLGSRYDLVLIDSPPVLPVADARVIGRAADAVVYLVRYSTTPAAAVREGLSSLTELGVEPVGVVMTMVDPRHGTRAHGGAAAYGA